MDRELVDKISSMFVSLGAGIYSAAVDTVRRYGMQEHIGSGVLVGFSGGADSVMLLCFLLEYRRRTNYFPILAVHINHGIRGEEADSDEAFSKHICIALGVEFLSVRLDIPAIAKTHGLGFEEAARNARYSEFYRIISGRSDISSIAVAHNSDDNAETVIFNILRGAGSRGASGIRPIRDRIIRPLIHISKSDILSLLAASGVPFVTDSTNFSLDYSRNFIRHKIMPQLRNFSNNAESMISRFSDNLRTDDEYITEIAARFISERCDITNADLRELHTAVFIRVLSIMAKESGAGVTAAVSSKIKELLFKDNFSYSLPGGVTFICEQGLCRILRRDEENCQGFRFNLKLGCNVLEPFCSEFILSESPIEKTYLNVYKISIQADISSAIIVGNLYLRSKKDGDSIFYGGMTRKLKKLFNDRKIPPSKRHLIPILCDDRGVVWAPGLGARDDKPTEKQRKKLYAVFSTNSLEHQNETRLYSVSEFKK